MSEPVFTQSDGQHPAIWGIRWIRYAGAYPCPQEAVRVELRNSDLSLYVFNNSITDTKLEEPKVKISNEQAKTIVTSEWSKHSADESLKKMKTNIYTVGDVEIRYENGVDGVFTKPRGIYSVVVEITGGGGYRAVYEAWVDAETGKIVGWQ